MFTFLKNLIEPYFTRINEASTFVSSSYAPYSRPVNIVSCFSSIGLTFYGLYPLWTQNQDLELSSLSKPALTFIYALHIGAVSFAVADTLGQQAYSPALTSALVGATAMFKSVSDFIYEVACTSKLHDKQRSIQKQLLLENSEFSRYLDLLDFLARSEYEFKLLEEECSELQLYLNKIMNFKKEPINLRDLFVSLQQKCIQKKLKRDYLNEFLQHPEAVEEYNGINVKISALVQEKDSLKNKRKNEQAITRINRLEAEIDSLGFKQQCWIKFKETQRLIQKLTNIAQQLDANSQAEKIQLQSLIDNLLPKPAEAELEDDILSLSFEAFSARGRNKPLFWLKAYLSENIKILEQSAAIQRERYDIKKRFFEQINKHDPSTDLNEKTKALVQLQRQATLAAITERSKGKSANFSVISSFLALIICAIPDVQSTKIINQLKNGVGFASLVVGNLDMIRKYILNMKLTANENKLLKQLLQDASFNQIAKVKDDAIRQQLFNKINNLNREGELQSHELEVGGATVSKNSKELRFENSKTRNKNKSILLPSKQKAILVVARK